LKSTRLKKSTVLSRGWLLVYASTVEVRGRGCRRACADCGCTAARCRAWPSGVTSVHDDSR
jgi:hypothetical protein